MIKKTASNRRSATHSYITIGIKDVFLCFMMVLTYRSAEYNVRFCILCVFRVYFKK